MFSKLYNFFHGFLRGDKPENLYLEIMGLKLSTSEHGNDSIALSFLTTDRQDIETNRLFIEIRRYVSNRSSANGVFLTEKQYNWMISKLVESKELEVRKTYKYKISEDNSAIFENLKISPKKKRGYELSQQFLYLDYKIVLSEKEIDQLIEQYTSFDKILDIFESQLIEK